MQVQIDQLLIGRPSNPADAMSAGDDLPVLPHPQVRAVNGARQRCFDAETLLDEMIRRSRAHD